MMHRIGVAIGVASIAAVLLAAHTYTSPRYSFHTINGGPLVVRFDTRTGNAEVCRLAADDTDDHHTAQEKRTLRTPEDTAAAWAEWVSTPASLEAPHIDCFLGNQGIQKVRRMNP